MSWLSIRTAFASLAKRPPLRWIRAAEDALFRLASEVEYRLKITPRGTRIVPSTFDRRMVRLFLTVVPILIASLFWENRSQRLRALFAVLVVAALLLAWIVVADAFPAKRRNGTTRRP